MSTELETETEHKKRPVASLEIESTQKSDIVYAVTTTFLPVCAGFLLPDNKSLQRKKKKKKKKHSSSSSSSSKKSDFFEAPSLAQCSKRTLKANPNH